METLHPSSSFIVWGFDDAAYGPVELPTLVSWIKDGRVTAESWLFCGKEGAWLRAPEVPELQMFFGRKAHPTDPNSAVDFRALRRIKILASMSDDQLQRFADLVELQRVPQWSVVVHKGDPGDSMFFILEGELRVRLQEGGREDILATLGVGECFGDISLFDNGPRSADVVANVESVLVRVSAESLSRISREAPEVATNFLFSLGRTLSARIRADNKRFGDSVRLSHAA